MSNRVVCERKLRYVAKILGGGGRGGGSGFKYFIPSESSWTAGRLSLLFTLFKDMLILKL